MADVYEKATGKYLESQNTPDFPTEDWAINPLFSPDKATVLAVPDHYRKWDSGTNTISEMTQAEKDATGVPLTEYKSNRKATIRAATEGHTHFTAGQSLEDDVDAAADETAVDAVVDNR